MLTAKLVSRASRLSSKASVEPDHARAAGNEVCPVPNTLLCGSQTETQCDCAELPGVLTAKLVGRASRLSSKAKVEADLARAAGNMSSLVPVMSLRGRNPET